MNYQSVITLNTKSRTELTWQIENLRFCNSHTFSQLKPQMIIQTNASLTGWGAVRNEDQTSRQWSGEERALRINVLERLVIKLTLFSFNKGKRVKAILFQIDNMTVLSRKEHVIKLSKEIWHNHNMSITAEYLLSKLNTVTHRDSRKNPEWLLHPKVFKQFLEY